MKKITLLFIVSFFLHSCYTSKITSDFLIPLNQNRELFSDLKGEFDEYSFNSVFQPSKKIVDELIEGEAEFQREISIVRENQNSVDAKNLLRKYMMNSALNDANAKGKIVFNVSFYDFRKNDAFSVFSVLSLGLLNLAGLPSGSFVNTIEMQASIYSDSGELLQSFTGFGRDSYLTGVYYHSPEQKRPSFIKAVKNAIHEIDNQILANQNYLAESLH
ncbi:MAG TPA: hypothetical protein VLA03_05015 [Draconibacterium sp.]|nr:hypothetical protein [Draconibacterium sp.]